MKPSAAAADALSSALRGHPGLVAAYLFGSAARGETEPRDLDIAVMFESDVDGFRRSLEIQVELETSTGLPVDVHDFDALPLELQMRTLREGRVLVDADAPQRVRREIAVRFAYEDFRPYRDRILAGAVNRLASRDRRG